MAIRKSGPIRFSDLQLEFGGANPISLSEYYRGGGLVQDLSFNATIAAGSYGTEISVDSFHDTGIGTRSGEVAMTEPGWYIFEIPSGLYDLSFVLVGAGGGGGAAVGSYGGGGGGGGSSLARNNWAVTPGQKLIVYVGHGGWGGTYGAEAQDGENTSIFTEDGTELARAGGGERGRNGTSSSSSAYGGSGGRPFYTLSTDNYGWGGDGHNGRIAMTGYSGAPQGGGGGGAGGYAGTSTTSGGDGGGENYDNGDAGNYGGGGGAGGTRYEYSYGGGGVNVFPADYNYPDSGSGANTVNSGTFPYSLARGKGGSWGQDGTAQSLNVNNWHQYPGGGDYGGGGSGAYGGGNQFATGTTTVSGTRPGRAGGNGAARFIWWANGDDVREFPNTNAHQDFSSAFYTTEYVQPNYTPININNGGAQFGSVGGGFVSNGTRKEYSWTVPTGVTQISVVCIGAGGGGSAAGVTGSNQGGAGGGGGGLQWRNNISVTPGETLTIQVGIGGPGGTAGQTGTAGNGKDGGDSYIKRGTTTLAYATGGAGGDPSSVADAAGGSGGSGGYTNRGGGNGGAGGRQLPQSNYNGSGGGGAGGYDGNGGNGGYQNSFSYNSTFNGQSADPGSGGGGGGAVVFLAGTAANHGGGVGFYGKGSTGSGASFSSSSVRAGGSGSNGSLTKYGGGGGSPEDDSLTTNGGTGGSGAVRIVWRRFGDAEFPSTNVGNQGNEDQYGI